MKTGLKSRAESKSKRQVHEDAWRKELEDLTINDENWWCMITMLVESSPEDTPYVSILNESAETGGRKSIHLLSLRQVMASIKSLSKVEQDICPTVQGVCHYANKFLSQGDGTLPTWLLARMIKFLVHRAKVENVTRTRREMILERDMEMETQHMQMAGSAGPTSDTQQHKRTTAQDPYANGKANTRLRKRDEKWREAVYVDDAPEDGPNLYVVLLGFYDLDLPLELIRLNVPLTALLRLKRPEDVIELGRDDCIGGKRTNFSDSGKLGLRRFWDELEKRINESDTTMDYCCLMQRTFCPPVISPLDTESPCDSVKADLYDRVSYIVYDLYDVYRQHVSYIRRMKLQSGIVEAAKRERGNMKTYETILNSIPMEAVGVPIILDAILAQVEDDLGSSANNLIENLENSSDHSGGTDGTVLRSVSEDFIGEESKVTCEDETGGRGGDMGEEIQDSRLILYGDDFTLTNYLADARNGIFSPSEERVSSILEISKNLDNVLRNMGVARIWNDFRELSQDTLRMYRYHMEKLGRCFESETIDAEDVYHYVNLMIFDKMILESDNARNQMENDRPRGESTFSDVSSRYAKCKSTSDYKISYSRDDFLFSKNNTKPRSSSDGRIDYEKPMDETFECMAVISLINPLEIFHSTSSVKIKLQTAEGPSLGEFDSVELLSASIFLQTLYNCLCYFSECQYRYSQLTDSVLLRFYHGYQAKGVYEKRETASIPTPVCLRDFCDYVISEQVDWLQAEENEYRNEMKSFRDTASKLKDAENTYTKDFREFSDEDFILSSSLKATSINKKEGPPVPIQGTELKSKRKVNSTSKESKEIRVRALGERAESNERKGRDKKLMESETSFLPRRRILEARCAEDEEPYDFIGYDLGNVRIQISIVENTFFSKDGTSVRVRRENWLRENSQLHIAIAYPECSLKLCRTEDDPSSHPYHLMTKDGAIIAFSRDETRPETNFSQEIAKRIITDFRASFTSGLLVEPIFTDSAETPLHVQQRNVSQEQNSLDASQREAYRKFLRNGTVLKFLVNGAVIVLRPNGTIVTCDSFARAEKPKNVDRTLAKGKKDSNQSLSIKSKKKESNSVKSRNRPANEEDQLSKISNTLDDQTNSTAGLSDPIDFQISSYTVLDHDGNHYRFSNDRFIRLDRLIVRNQTDHEMDETFIRRADGTNMLLNSNGELITSFTDGTRIITGYVIESESVICDWTVQELQIFFGQHESVQNLSREIYESNFNVDSFADPDVVRILTEDSFVLVALTCRFEHKNYATVMYDQSTLGCALLMPNDVEVTISADGRYDIKVESRVALKIEKGQLEFSRRISQACERTSVSVYNFDRPITDDDDDPVDSLSRTEDVFGNIFIVNWDGTNEYRESVIESDSSCVPRDDSTIRGSYRVFAMKRDLSGYEYHHKSALIGQDSEATADKDTSIFHCPVPGRSQLFYSISLARWNQKMFSKKCPQPYQFSELRPTNYKRRHVLRSTYSIPYDWPFPFGKNGNGITANTWDWPLKRNTEKGISPDSFIIRLFRQIKLKDSNVIINLSKGLYRYFHTMINEFGEYRSYVAKDPRTEAESKLESHLRAICLGQQKIISQKYFEPYLLSRPSIDATKKIVKPESERKGRKIRRNDKDEIEWYRECRRQQTKIPYFDLANGACFLWINDCLTKILKPDPSLTAKNIEEKP